jgi:hypothetical protein
MTRAGDHRDFSVKSFWNQFRVYSTAARIYYYYLSRSFGDLKNTWSIRLLAAYLFGRRIFSEGLITPFTVSPAISITSLIVACLLAIRLLTNWMCCTQ